jgi:tetratricopeptide (TPR) repeat protein
MATDLYAKCPCGSGKKIKFCCRDIISDIERIERMLAGDQRNAALEKIEKLEVKHPHRPALLSMKARVFFDLKRIADAAPVVAQLLDLEPDNPAGLSMRALLLLSEDDVHEALRHLHRSLRMSDGTLSQMVYRAYITICVALIERNQYVSAYAHLLTMVSITRGEDRASLSLLMNLTSSDQLPAIFQGLMILDDCPDNVSWKRELDLALQMYRRGDWSEAATMIENMSIRILDEPVLLRNLAILQAWTVQPAKAAKSFHQFASVRGVEMERAVEAEACAQVLDPLNEDDWVDMVSLTHDIDDAEQLLERLLSSDLVDSVPVRKDADSDEPPPKAQFLLFDRAIPKEDSDSTLADLPRQYGTITLWGRETDRSARIAVVLYRDENFEAQVQLVNETAGLNLDPHAEVETVSRNHKIQRLFQADFRVSPTTPLERYNELLHEWIHGQLCEVWPQQKLSFLDGNTPAQAAQIPKLTKAVLGAILNLELWLDRQRLDFDVNQIRSKLNLPICTPIDPTGLDIRDLSPTQLRLVELEKLSDDDLKFLFEVVSVRPNGKFLYRIGQEVLRRPSMKDEVDFMEVHERLADTSPNTDEQLWHLQQARDLAVDRGESPATWLVGELDLQIGRGDLESAKRLIAEIQTRYLREPGISQMFAGVLSKYGLMPAGAEVGSTAAAATGSAPPTAAPVTGAASVWTPDMGDSSPSSESAGGESKIWVPD